MKKRILAAMMAAALALACTACAPPETTTSSQGGSTSGSADGSVTQTAGEPQYGGSLKATINGDPTSLDAMMVNVEQEQIPATHIFETAISLDASGAPWPGVCDYTYEDNVLTLTVRDGVTFHNGNPCTAEDVKASFDRWVENVSSARTQVMDHAQSVEVVDNSLVITFAEPAPVALATIGPYDQGLYIIPKEICEQYGSERIADADCIGTGPYKYVEHLPDRYVLLERYDEYVPTENEGASGMAAPKMAYCDELYFYPVSDKMARITGVQTGEYDVGIGVPANMMATLSADPNLVVETKDLGIFCGLVFNNQSGPCADQNLRNAILACLDMDDLMLAAQGDASLYRLNPCVMMTTSQWYVEDSLGKYNAPDLEKAQEYLGASSYNGETLVFITTKDNDYMYKTAMVVAEAVKPIGINMDVQVYDNATLKEYRDDPTKYDMFSSGLGDKNDPSEVVFLDSAWAGFWDSEAKNALVEELSNAVEFEDRYAIWEEICQLVYEEVPNITFGERINPIVYQKYVHNLFDTKQKFYWNTWIDGESAS